MMDIIECIVSIGRFQWFPVKQIGDRCLMVAIKPLFRGYYSLEPCDFLSSELYKFLNNKFIKMLEEDGVDISKLSDITIPTKGQYSLYIKNKLPPCGSYLLRTTNMKDKADAVDDDGNEIQVLPREKYNVRPCFFIDAAYLQELVGDVAFTETLFGSESVNL